MSYFAAALDANVLCSYPLTSVLLELAEARLYRPIWSKDIHGEWIRAVTRSRSDIAPEKLERRRAAMYQALPCHELSSPTGTLHRIASMPFRRMTLSRASAGPLALFAPRSNWEM